MFHQTYTRFVFLEKNLVVGISLTCLLLVTVVSILYVIRNKHRRASGLPGP